MTEWKKYTGSDEQIAEIKESKAGFLLKSSDHMFENEIIYADADFSCIDAFNVTHYLICKPNPNRAMIKQQADTGQPVWWKHKNTGRSGQCHNNGVSHAPFFAPEYFEYSFTPFEEEV